MSQILLVRDYPQPPAQVWRALTEPPIMARWMIAAEPRGFSPVVGTRFQFVGEPRPGWSGGVDCEVLEVHAPSLLRYSWSDAGEGEHMCVTYRLEPLGAGTRFTFLHEGFKGLGGLLLAKLVIGPIRKKMFGARLPQLLSTL